MMLSHWPGLAVVYIPITLTTRVPGVTPDFANDPFHFQIAVNCIRISVCVAVWFSLYYSFKVPTRVTLNQTR